MSEFGWFRQPAVTAARTNRAGVIRSMTTRLQWGRGSGAAEVTGAVGRGRRRRLRIHRDWLVEFLRATVKVGATSPRPRRGRSKDTAPIDFIK